ncbi:hypothetical protein [Peribacillus sp. SCS-155]|uniref:hypothetical protein n=1 Tax=Peribacillus sedimenti TaxID=3115297 RepID=UPI0039060D5B
MEKWLFIWFLSVYIGSVKITILVQSIPFDSFLLMKEFTKDIAKLSCISHFAQYRIKGKQF